MRKFLIIALLAIIGIAGFCLVPKTNTINSQPPGVSVIWETRTFDYYGGFWFLDPGTRVETRTNHASEVGAMNEILSWCPAHEGHYWQVCKVYVDGFGLLITDFMYEGQCGTMIAVGDSTPGSEPRTITRFYNKEGKELNELEYNKLVKNLLSK